MAGRKYQAKKVKVARVLVVGDHNPLRISLRDWVGMNLPEARILEAKNGKEALDVALAKRPHIVLLDTGVDVMQGIEATRRIRGVLPDVKIVILTMHENPEYTADAKAAGASACMLKREMGIKLMPVLKDLMSHDAHALESMSE